jgi:uncharacterized protein
MPTGQRSTNRTLTAACVAASLLFHPVQRPASAVTITTAIPANTTPTATSPHPGMPPKSRMYQGSCPIGYFRLLRLMAATVRPGRYAEVTGHVDVAGHCLWRAAADMVCRGARVAGGADLRGAGTMTNTTSWTRFWDRGAIWKAIIVAAAYYGLYELMGVIVLAIFGDEGSPMRGDAGGPADVLIATMLPIVLGSIILLIFIASVGWWRDIFGRQTIPGRRWMWAAIPVVLVINASALASIDYVNAGGALVGAWMLAGLAVGFAEEVLTRGIVIQLARKAGHRELIVALASAGIFAALHIGNVFTTDQNVGVTALQVVYTFFFGICMYLAFRVTRTLIAPILLHASTDPTLFLHGLHPAVGNPLSIIPPLSTPIIIVAGVIFLIALIVSERRNRARIDS